MKSAFYNCMTLMIVLAAAGACSRTDVKSPDRDLLYQYGTLDGLMAGVYDGDLSFSELKSYGDFGLGTFNRLDGEMIALDGHIYRVGSDGSVAEMPDSDLTPFSVITCFDTDETVNISGNISLDSLKQIIDSQIPSFNLPCAIRIDGIFSYIKTRSVPAQQRPYPPLTDVLKTQPTFEFHSVKGTILGFRLPTYMSGANAPGYHFHFLTGDRSGGGHLLNATCDSATVRIDISRTWFVQLPDNRDFDDYGISEGRYY